MLDAARRAKEEPLISIFDATFIILSSHFLVCLLCSDPQDVLVIDNLIAKIGENIDPPTGDKKVAIVDCAGKTLMPGLIDMHSHLCFQEGMLEGRDDFDMMAMGAMCGSDLQDYLNQGFTTCRDAGGNVLGIAKAVNVGRIPGPRM